MDDDTQLTASWCAARKIRLRLIYPALLAIPAASACGMGIAMLVATIVDLRSHGWGASTILLATGQFTLCVIVFLMIFPQLFYSLVIPFRVRSLRYDDDYLFVRRRRRIHSLSWTDVSTCGREDVFCGNLVPKDVFIVFRSGEKIRLPSRIAATGPLLTIVRKTETRTGDDLEDLD